MDIRMDVLCTDDFLRTKISWKHRLPYFLTHGASLDVGQGWLCLNSNREWVRYHVMMVTKFLDLNNTCLTEMAINFRGTNNGRKVWGTAVLFLSGIMYRKVIHVNLICLVFSAIFSGPWFVEMQKFCRKGPGLTSFNDLFCGAHIWKG